MKQKLNRIPAMAGPDKNIFLICVCIVPYFILLLAQVHFPGFVSLWTEVLPHN